LERNQRDVRDILEKFWRAFYYTAPVRTEQIADSREQRAPCLREEGERAESREQRGER
jgi:hypothetical protein